jgi:hypothetical protein
MKNLGTRSSILVGLCGAALMITSIGCGSSSTPGTDASGNGGTSAGGSSGGGGTGGQAAPALSYTFGSSVQGWSINVYHDTGTSTNIGWELSPDAGIDAAMPPMLTHDDTDGDPAATAPGCLKLTTTFTGYNQYVDIKIGINPMLDLSGKTLTAKVQLASATGGTFPGGAILEADTTPSYSYGGSGGLPLTTSGTWKTLQLALDTVTPLTGQTYDPKMVIQVGVQFYSGSPPTDGGTTLGPIEATFLIDTVEAR